MKNGIVFFVAMIMTLSAATVFADDDTTSFTLGIKAWYNSQIQSIGSQGSPKPSTTSDKPVFLAGPALNFRTGSWFVGANYLLSMSDYTYTQHYNGNNIDSLTAFESNTETATVKNSRKDLDATVGYMFTPSVGIFLGYKTISLNNSAAYEGTTTYYLFSPSQYNYTSNSKTTLQGPVAGILGNIPLGEKTVIYGNIAVMSLNFKETYSATSDGTRLTPDTGTLTGASGEIGVAAAFTSWLSGAIGYKYEKLSGVVGNNEHGKYGKWTENDVNSGMTLGLTYSF